MCSVNYSITNAQMWDWYKSCSLTHFSRIQTNWGITDGIFVCVVCHSKSIRPEMVTLFWLVEAPASSSLHQMSKCRLEKHFVSSLLIEGALGNKIPWAKKSWQYSFSTCTMPPPGLETSSSAAGLGSPGGDGRSAGPAPLSPPPGLPSVPAKTGNESGKGSG